VPEFFVPKAKTPEQAEEVWQATKKFAEKQTRWEASDRRVRRVEYEHHGKQEWAEAGEPYSVAEAGGGATPSAQPATLVAS
jgi:hypothetical protein